MIFGRKFKWREDLFNNIQTAIEKLRTFPLHQEKIVDLLQKNNNKSLNLTFVDCFSVLFYAQILKWQRSQN